MKIIAFSAHDYFSSSSPMTSRLRAYMKALLFAGVEAEVFMISSNSRPDGVFEGVPFRYEIMQSSRRHVYAFRKELASIFAQKAQECDLIFTSEDTSSMITELCHAVHSVKGKIVIELNENPYTIISSRKDFRIVNYLKRFYFIYFTLKKVDGVITISRALHDLALKHVRNGVPVERIPILSHVKSVLPDQSPLPESKFILHAGSLSEQKDGIKAMIKSFHLANSRLNDKLKLVFTSTTAFPSLIKWITLFIEKNGLENNVIFTGYLEEQILKKYLDNAALAIINKPKNSQNMFNFPTKLTDLLPRGVPCIISKTGELNNFFTDRVNAYMVEPDSWQEIAEKIVEIVNNPEIARKVGQRGMELCEREFYYENHANSLMKFYSQILKGGYA